MKKGRLRRGGQYTYLTYKGKVNLMNLKSFMKEGEKNDKCFNATSG